METAVEEPVGGSKRQEFVSSGNQVLESAPQEYLIAILESLQTMKNGDFSARLPGTWTGLPGKIADNFNEIVAANQQMALEL